MALTAVNQHRLEHTAVVVACCRRLAVPAIVVRLAEVHDTTAVVRVRELSMTAMVDRRRWRVVRVVRPQLLASVAALVLAVLATETILLRVVRLIVVGTAGSTATAATPAVVLGLVEGQICQLAQLARVNHHHVASVIDVACATTTGRVLIVAALLSDAAPVELVLAAVVVAPLMALSLIPLVAATAAELVVSLLSTATSSRLCRCCCCSCCSTPAHEL